MSRVQIIIWVIITVFCLSFYLPISIDINASYKNERIELKALQNEWEEEKRQWKESLPTVCYTRTGYAYHRCYHYSRTNYEINLYDADQRYSPCEKCNPPRISSFPEFTLPKPNTRIKKPNFFVYHYLFTSSILIFACYYFSLLISKLPYISPSYYSRFFNSVKKHIKANKHNIIIGSVILFIGILSIGRIQKNNIDNEQRKIELKLRREKELKLFNDNLENYTNVLGREFNHERLKTDLKKVKFDTMKINCMEDIRTNNIAVVYGKSDITDFFKDEPLDIDYEQSYKIFSEINGQINNSFSINKSTILYINNYSSIDFTQSYNYINGKIRGKYYKTNNYYSIYLLSYDLLSISCNYKTDNYGVILEILKKKLKN